MQNLDHNSYAWQWSERFHERVTINGGNFYSKCQAVKSTVDHKQLFCLCHLYWLKYDV